MKKSSILCAFATVLFALGAVPMWSQTIPVQGTVTEGGKPLQNATVTLTNLGTSRIIKAKTDKKGEFNVVGVQIADYEVEVSSSSGEKLYKQKMTIAPSENSTTATVKIDVGQVTTTTNTTPTGQAPAGDASAGASGQSGQQQQPKYTKEQVEEIKKKNEQAQNFNVLIKQVNDAISSKNWQAAVEPLQTLIAGDPNNWQYYSGLGDAQLNLGQFDQAADTYQKGIQAAESNTTVDPKNPNSDPAKKKVGEAKMLTNQGNAYLKLHKNKEAVDAYTKAASMDPNPGVAYFNLCATQYNTGNTEGALDACDKAIAADPNKADAYFIKGSLLIASSKTDKDGKITAPPGTAEALNKYLELQPEGQHAKDVKDMLTYIGSKVETTYKKKAK
jgi:tetratricopeptide (TPR) repeat protein